MRPQTYLDLLDPLAAAPVTVRPGRCVLVRNRHASCSRCAEACTSGCISFVDGRVAVEPKRCVGCGTCATVCPTGALEPQEPTDRQLYEACLQAMDADGRVVIVCERALCDTTLGEGPARVRCLGRVDESLIALLARAGASDVALAYGTCEGCRERSGKTVAEDVCLTANALLEAWGQKPIARLVACENAGVSAVDAADEAEPVGEGSADARRSEGDADGYHRSVAARQRVKRDGTLPHALPSRRSRLLQALDDAFGEPGAQTPVATRLWGRVSVDVDSCRSCLACAVFCPTEALHKVVGDDGSVSLRHYAGRCVKCSCCADVCPTGALVVHDEVRAGDLRTGACEAYDLPLPPRARSPHQMRDAMVSLLGCDFIYER